MDDIPEDLMEALMVLHAEGVLSDHIYHVRDSEGDGWTGPRVKAFGDACNVIQWYVDKQFADFAAEDAAKEELERITPPNAELLRLANPRPNESAPVKDVVFTIKDGTRSKVFQDFMAKFCPTGTETSRISGGN